MVMVLFGHKNLDFENSNGERVKGIQAFVGYSEDGVTGQRTDKLFFKDGFDLPQLQVGATYEVSFNHRGKVEKVTALPANRLNLGKQQ